MDGVERDGCLLVDIWLLRVVDVIGLVLQLLMMLKCFVVEHNIVVSPNSDVLRVRELL